MELGAVCNFREYMRKKFTVSVKNRRTFRIKVKGLFVSVQNGLASTATANKMSGRVQMAKYSRLQLTSGTVCVLQRL